jgi:hypothetical protein
MERKDLVKHFGSEAAAVGKMAIFLACVAFDKGAKKYELELEDVTEAGVDKGCWSVTIQRTDI